MESGIYQAVLSYGFLIKKKIQFDFDMLAWFLLYQDFGWEFDDIGKKPPEELMAHLLVSAAKSHAVKLGKPIKIDIKKIGKILENSKTSESEKLKAVFAQSSRAIPAEIADKIGGQVKKKQRGMT
jgi:hypothetical protein